MNSPALLLLLVLLLPVACAVVPTVAPHVAFDGRSLVDWTHTDGRPAEWTVTSDGALQVAPGSGNVITRQHWGDVLVELEFRCPAMPDAIGQARANSGVYVHGLYEVQVLDSYGFEKSDDSCGAIYKVAAPMVNASYPPDAWQSYRIELRAPRFDADGAKVASARMTVHHNGILVHDDVEVPHPTGGHLHDVETGRGPLMLQDHGDLVAYRDVRLTPLDPD